MRQFRYSVSAPENLSSVQSGLHVTDEAQDETTEIPFGEDSSAHDVVLQLPDDYKVTVIQYIIIICSQHSYANINNFRWYLQVLVELCQGVISDRLISASSSTIRPFESGETIATIVGCELRNVAVRVSDIRSAVVGASSTMLVTQSRSSCGSQSGSQEVLKFAAWVVGEYADFLGDIPDTLNALLTLSNSKVNNSSICINLQAIPKLLMAYINSVATKWNQHCKSRMSLLLAQIVRVYEKLVINPSIEVQERAVGLLEMFRLAEEAVNGHSSEQDSMPFLLTHALPSLFRGSGLNPVAPSAQKRVPCSEGLDLIIPMNHGLDRVIKRAEQEPTKPDDMMEFKDYYDQGPPLENMAETALHRLGGASNSVGYLPDQVCDPAPNHPTKSGVEGHEERGDDTYYIRDSCDPDFSAPALFHDMLARNREQDVDIDAIPIMDLDLGPMTSTYNKWHDTSSEPREKIHVTADEEIDIGSDGREKSEVTANVRKERGLGIASKGKVKRSLLEVDSSGIGVCDKESDPADSNYGDVTFDDEVEIDAMTKALAEVERARLEMQRAAERVRITGDIPDEGMLVKKKTRKKTRKKLSARTA